MSDNAKFSGSVPPVDDAIIDDGEIYGELADVWRECSQPDWDGYNAVPVSGESYENAKRLVAALPPGTPQPTAGAEPDGQMTLEWRRSRRRTLSISVSPDDDLHYAALLGPARSCGTEPFRGETPQMLLDLIRRVYEC